MPIEYWESMNGVIHMVNDFPKPQGYPDAVQCGKPIKDMIQISESDLRYLHNNPMCKSCRRYCGFTNDTD